jgi:hypothetical protein
MRAGMPRGAIFFLGLAHAFRRQVTNLSDSGCLPEIHRYISAPTAASPDCATQPLDQGQVAEWLKAHAWKVCIRESVSRVRIPLCPPSLSTTC